MTSSLDQRELVSFVALSVVLHLAALLAPRPERTPTMLEPPAVLVMEMVETAPVTTAAAAPPPPQALAPPPPAAAAPPPPPPPVAEKPLLPEVVRKPPPTKPAVVAKPAPKPAPAKPVAPPAPSAPSPPSVATATAAVSPRPAAASSTSSTSPVAKARYEDQLYAWLVRHKEYPVAAQRRGIQGRPVVRVRIDRGGQLVESAIARPSRHAVLDEAAVALVRRAAPFPPIPGDLAVESFEFDAPIDYLLR